MVSYNNVLLLVSYAGAFLQGLKHAIEHLEKKVVYGLREMDAHLSGQIRTLTDSIHTLSDSLRVLLREMSCMPEILRQQVHMQRKQDQLATKQDLLHTTIVGEKYHTPLPIMSLPPKLPPIPISSARDSHTTRPRNR